MQRLARGSMWLGNGDQGTLNTKLNGTSFSTPQISHPKPIGKDINEGRGCKVEVEVVSPVKPFSLLGHGEDGYPSIDEIQSQLPQRPTIQDAYPCTPLQEGLFALSLRQEGLYMLQAIYKLPGNIDITRFKAAWQMVADSNTTLRTRFLQTRSWGMVQVVLESTPIKWQEGNDLQAYLWDDCQIPPEFGLNLLRFGLISDFATEQTTFVWTFHHALIDGWAWRLLLAQVDQLYNDNLLDPLVEFNQFIACIGRLGSKDEHERFWSDHLASSSSHPFPALPSESYLPCADSSEELHIKVPKALNAIATTSTIIQAAWATLVARRTNSSEATFGLVLAGRNLDIPGLKRINGPTFTTVPMCISVDPQETVSGLFEKIYQTRKSMKAHQHIGIQNIRRLGPKIAKSGNFQNLLVIQPQVERNSRSLFNDTANSLDYWSRQNAYALTMECNLVEGGFAARASFDSNVLSRDDLKGILKQFKSVIEIFSVASLLKDIQPLKENGFDTMVICDTGVEKVDSCVHDVIWETTQGRLSDQAITAWDGNLTYSQLHDLSDRLAHRLQNFGVGPEVKVAIVFEKSLWVIVAILSILKAGGVFVPLDPSHPKVRIQSLVQQIDRTLLLCSEKFFGSFAGIACQTISVCKSTLEDLPAIRDPLCNTVQPSNAAYIIFTSGSTGNPKGCVIEHAACSTNMRQIGNFTGITRTSRVLQNSSYTFDACIVEILITLSVGGILCIPAEDEKMNNITAAINRMQANWALFTPSFARLLNPDSVPTLKTLVIGGEPCIQEDIDRWNPTVRLIQLYGPTEGCVACIGNQAISRGMKPSKIGKAFVGSCMVLDDEMQIVKPGVVGELYIGGPHLARGYLNDTQKTAAAFVSTPPSLEYQNLRCKRWYKTGDLVKQEIGGSALEILGRRDAQVKLRGYRIDLGEVEHVLRQNVDGIVDLAATVVTPADDSGPAFLAVFFVLKDPSDAAQCQDVESFGLAEVCFSPSAIANLLNSLHTCLPSYMVPKLFIPLSTLPLTTSGKIDRRSLQARAAELSKEQHVIYSGGREEHESPSTEMEVHVRHLWAKTLNIDPDLIGRYDNFIRLGGDSILAMRLVSLARDAGICLTVRGIFQHPSLSELAKTATRTDAAEPSPVSDLPAFALIGGLAKASSIVKGISHPGISMANVADIYPCTSFQEGIMALSISNPGSYIAQHVFELSYDLSSAIPMFRAAWNNVVASHPILRTRIVQSESAGLVQLVCKDAIEWKIDEDLEKYMARDRAVIIGLGSSLSRYGIVGPDIAGKYHFVWTTHHSIYDAWSIALTLNDFDNEYRKLKTRNANDKQPQRNPRTSFNQFVASLQSLDFTASKRFWLAELGTGEPSKFPTVPMGYFPLPNEVVIRNVHFSRSKNSEFRTSTLVRTAWAITISNYTSSNDIVFGATLSGRTDTFANLASVVGPTVTTVPVRVLVESQTLILEQLRKTESQMIEMMPFEQTGLSEIRKMDAKLKQACDFQTLLVIQPKEHSDVDNSILGRRMSEFDNVQVFDTYALTLECTLTNDGLSAKALLDPNVIEVSQMNRILSQFKHILQQLCLEEAGTTIHDINTVNPQDLEEIWQWNAILPDASSSCVHHLIEEAMLRNPHAQAICSWDGDLTRGQLDSLSSKLAQELIRLGVSKERKVPLLFDKSKWAVVAILAIIKAGAAFVPLDALHPIARHASIIEQINAKLILCSPEHENRCIASLPHLQTIVVDEAHIARLPVLAVPVASDVGPSNALYVIFTSGTTGAPKGTVTEHGAYCSGARDHAKALCFSEASRFLQFASYSFDTSIEDILTTLMTGGCLCIPSEEERASDLAAAIRRMNVDTADLTSSYISSISPDAVPSLRRITLGGEPLTSKVVKVWADRVHLINAYGITECCVTSLVNANISTTTDPTNIGRAVGAVSWIVDAEDANLLMPIGATGELLIEGPAQARGYLNDEAKTNAVFIHGLKWTSNTSQGRRPGRLYKTGDLVRYNADGTISYLGRKDTQIKLRGQRIELSEIEFWVLDSPRVKNAIALLPTAGPYKDNITALIELDIASSPTGNGEVHVLDDSVLKAADFSWSDISDHLREVLPSYMIPSSWIAIATLPLSTSAKVDRSRLSNWLSNLPSEYRTVHAVNERKAPPIPLDDGIALSISETVADLLTPNDTDPNPDIVGYDANLTSIGIDSIKMMSLSAFLKRTYGVLVPIKLLMNYRTTITDVSKHIYGIRASKEGPAPEKSFQVDLLSEFSLLDSELEAARQHLGVVFLTGATGFLGIQILRQLLNNGGVTKVIVQMRAKDSEHGRQRLVDLATSAHWWSDALSLKLEVWTGDLALPMLGLDSGQWDALQKVDAIIHNGAVVNWNADYHTLKPANVNSTVELLKAINAASSQPRPRFVYVSGGRFFEGLDDHTAAKKLATLDGYSQTKFLSEMLVRSSAKRAIASGHNHYMSVVKPGLIIGTEAEGIANHGDFLWRYVKAAVAIGAYPQPEKGGWLVVSSADRVAGTVVDALHRRVDEESYQESVDVVDGIKMMDFWDIVNAHLGEKNKLKQISTREWMVEIQRDINEKAERHPLWPVQYLLSTEGNLGLDGRPDGVDEGGLKVAVGRNVEFLMRSGYFSS
ncbi:acetyl-CoA synthetase-like protein [Acephala macrosclerotiorum]|nr:acetyl-CoA synthetase-like protein [Acephala macrosclerotiorum]